MTSVQERLAALHPEAAAELARVGEVARASTDPALLACCLRHVEALLTGASPPSVDDLPARESAFVAFTEQFVLSVAHVGDADVAALLEHATADEVYAFIGALYVTEMTRRVELVGTAVLA